MTRHPLPAAALAQHVGIVGKTGSGKTYAAKGMVERLLTEGRRVCIVDPTGAWWGLRSSADGQRAGFPVVVFGGEHADVPITSASGPALAALIGGGNLPCIIDLSEMLIGARHRFMEEFAEALHRINRTSLHLVIDEADEFAPQNPLPETKRMLHQIDRIVRRGRIRGFRVMFITQRPAVLHKNVLTQANTLVCLRLTAPQDRKAIEAWIEGQADRDEGKAVIASLASLPRGEGWLWAPELGVLERTRFPQIATFDSGRSPEDGEDVAEPQRLAEVDLSAIRETLAEAEQEAKANDPKALRARIAELEREIAANPAAKIIVDPAALDRARQDGYCDGYAQGRIHAVTHAASDLRLLAEQMERRLPSPIPEREPTVPPKPPEIMRAPMRAAAAGPGEKMSKAERLILTALAQYLVGRSKTQAAILTGYAVNGGGFNNAISALRSKGWIDGGQDALRITDAGMAALGPYDPLPRGKALLDYWLGRLGKAERSVLSVLAAAYPASLSKEETARRAGYEASGGGFNNALSRLRTLELIGGRGELRASEELA